MKDEPNEAAMKARASALLDSYGDAMPFHGLERQLVISLMMRFAADAIVSELVTIAGLTEEEARELRQ